MATVPRNMRDTLLLLRGLQELDQDLYRVKDELSRLPRELDRRRAAIEVHQSRIAEIDRQIHDTQTRIKEIEDMTTSQRQRRRKLDNESSASADQSLIAAYQHEMRSLKRDISEAEEEGLSLVEEVDRFTKERDQIQAVIDGLESDFGEISANVKSEMKAAEARRKSLDDERQKRMTGPLEPTVLTQYEKLLDAREGQAMAALEGRICQGCYVNVPSNIYVKLARASELVLCPSCGRILYLPERD